MPKNDLEIGSMCLQDLFGINNLKIPVYQRPYRWKEKNVNQLLDDIYENKNKKKQIYRIGTIILHKVNGEYNIVDGQQRLVTITIILYYLEHEKLPLLKSEFPHNDSKNNIKFNYHVIEKWFQNHASEKDALKKYLLKNCEFIKIELTDISEAFQFFDSQNARGKSPEGYDLLKAFHLREMQNEDEKINCVRKWENLAYRKLKDEPLLSIIIGQYLFRIRKWSRCEDAKRFEKDNIEEFKGTNLNKYKDYPYLKPYIITDTLTLQMELNPISYCYSKNIYYPFQINQMIINGKRFFEYVDYYSELYDKLFSKNDSDFYSFCENHTQYNGSRRDGDIFVRTMFEALILFYYDKFGENGFDELYKLFYCWAYALRLKQGRVNYTSIDKYIRENTNVFKRINDCYHPYQLFDLKGKILRIDHIKNSEGKIPYLIPETESVFKETFNHA